MHSNEPLHRPLFQEPTADIERDTPWDYPLGFLVGGIANASLATLGQQYFDAANLLTEAIGRRDWEDYRLTNPVLYLYRHSIELTLKAIVGNTGRRHDLDALARDFALLVKSEFSQEVPDWIMNRIGELAMIDPESTAFRYSENYDKAKRQRVPVDGELHVELSHLQGSMIELNSALVGVIAALETSEKSVPHQ